MLSPIHPSFSLATVSPRLFPSSSCSSCPSSRCGTNSPSLYQARSGAGLPVAEQERVISPVLLTSTLAGGRVFHRRCSQRGEITMESAVRSTDTRMVKVQTTGRLSCVEHRGLGVGRTDYVTLCISLYVHVRMYKCVYVFIY